MTYLENDVKFHHPFTAQIGGPTGCGKTFLLRSILENWRLLIDIDVVNLNVLWCHGQMQAVYHKPIPNVSVVYHDGFPDIGYLESTDCKIIVIDDLMEEVGSDKNMASLFTRGSHHKGISVFFIMQNIFHQASQMRTISLNSHYIIAMKNKRGKGQILDLGRQLSPRSPSALLEAYEMATSDKFSYLLIDNHPQTPDEISWRSDIFKVNNIGQLTPTIYMKIR